MNTIAISWKKIFSLITKYIGKIGYYITVKIGITTTSKIQPFDQDDHFWSVQNVLVRYKSINSCVKDDHFISVTTITPNEEILL